MEKANKDLDKMDDGLFDTIFSELDTSNSGVIERAELANFVSKLMTKHQMKKAEE